jgi:hypothetical protein
VPGLRNEDYIAFLDESGHPGMTVVGGFLIPARWLTPAERRRRSFVTYAFGSRSGRLEVKSTKLFNGKGIAIHAQSAAKARGGGNMSAKAAGRVAYTEALAHIGTIAEVRILAVGMATVQPVDVYRLWFWLLYACLVGNARHPRPRVPLFVIDGEDASFREAQDLVAYRFHKAFRGVQPYVQAGNDWFIGGSVHQQSELLPFMQMADLVAGAARLAMSNHATCGTWYDQHLRQPALAMRRKIDVSAHGLSELQRLDPYDRCGSGYANTLVVP